MKALSPLMRPREVSEAKSLAFAHVLRHGNVPERLNNDSKASLLDRH